MNNSQEIDFESLKVAIADKAHVRLTTLTKKRQRAFEQEAKHIAESAME